MTLSEADVRSALGALIDPNTGKDYVTSRSVKAVRVSGADVEVDIELGYPGKTQFEPIRREVGAALRKAGASQARVNVAAKVIPHSVQKGVKLVPGIKNIIAVASGKGGVGKSTTASRSSRWRATACRRSRSGFSSTSIRPWSGAGPW